MTIQVTDHHYHICPSCHNSRICALCDHADISKYIKCKDCEQLNSNKVERAVDQAWEKNTG